jgi:hypothetical protein
MFKIFATDEIVSESTNNATPAFYGEIVIGDLHETFVASLASWTRDDYDRHWRKALERLIAGADRSALITDYVEPPTHPSDGSYLVWWPLYRDGDTVYVQNHILFFGQLSQPFSSERPWDSVRDRETVNEDGQKISEWATTIEEIKYFLVGTELS